MPRRELFRRRRRDYAVALATLTVVGPVPAAAQTATEDARIEAIERQMRGLQSELKQLKNELNEAKQQARQSRAEAQRQQDQLRQSRAAARDAQQSAATAQAQAAQATAQAQAAQAAAQAPAAAAPRVAAVAPSGVNVSMPNGRPTISLANGRASFAIGTQVQFDMGGYFQNPSPTTQFPSLNNGVNLRRGRIFFVGRYDDFTLNITPDFGGSPDGSPTLYEANLNYTGIKPVTATIGYFKPWYTLYDSQSSNDFLLMERPSIVEISRNLAAGDARASAGAAYATDQLFGSFYLTGASYGQNTSSAPLNGEQLGIVGRIAGRPYYNKDWNIYVGMSGEDVFHPNINDASTNSETLIFQDRPELRIDQNRLISTGNLSASGANSYGGGVGINWRNFLVQGEYYKINVDQITAPTAPSPVLGFNGGYVEAGWVITGEPIRYSVGSAAFARPKVDDPFILGGAWGAWELAARWSVTDLNSNVIPGVSQTKTGGVYGGFQQIFGTALSWYPNDWVRLELQFQISNIDRLNSAGTTQIGQRFETLAGRVQVAF
jgi:phosphate-selective porin OprO and OprP